MNDQKSKFKEQLKGLMLDGPNFSPLFDCSAKQRLSILMAKKVIKAEDTVKLIKDETAAMYAAGLLPELRNLKSSEDAF